MTQRPLGKESGRQGSKSDQQRKKAQGSKAGGYCNPPPEHQWPPGYCPNTKGRPRKKGNAVKTPPVPNEFERRLLEDAKKVIGEIDGEPIDNLERIWRLIKAQSDKPEFARLTLQRYEAAVKANHAWYEKAVADLLAYKEYWGPIFEMHRITKRPMPAQYPHPDDIVITSPISFTFLGPVTEQEARDWEFFRQAREAFFTIAHEIIDWSGDVIPVEEAHARWAKLRRKYYRINRQLPAAFKKKYPARFPAFNQAA